MFKIHTDSLNSETWVNGTTQDAFTTYLYSPLKNITEVSIVTANFQATRTNVVYLFVDQLATRYNESTASANVFNKQLTTGGAAIYDPNSFKVSVQGAIAKFDVNQSGRTVYHQYDYDTKTVFRTPLNKLDRLSVHILDENGKPATMVSNAFVTFSFNCAQPSAQAPQRSTPVRINNSAR
jgi:hypothetical protein